LAKDRFHRKIKPLFNSGCFRTVVSPKMRVDPAGATTWWIIDGFSLPVQSIFVTTVSIQSNLLLGESCQHSVSVSSGSFFCFPFFLICYADKTYSAI
jgi:hypothetical protein